MDYEFDWDDAKAVANVRKHGVEFEDAMAVLRDPLAMTLFDSAHSDDEDRWISLGQSRLGTLLVEIHTFSNTGPNTGLVRIISARPATAKERIQYEEGSV
jgi:uncharacterized DUF497 family protein